MVSLLELSERFQSPVTVQFEEAITFATFLDITDGDINFELIDGKLVAKMAVQLDHEKLFTWLDRVVGTYIEERDLGILLGSRTAVEINALSGCLPNLVFVRRDNLAIVQQKAIYGTPDLVIEIVSPNDRPSDLARLTEDYRSIGVPEIVFIDAQKQHVRVMARQEDGSYIETTLTSGEWSSQMLTGFHTQVAWLLNEPRPRIRATVDALLAETGSTQEDAA